MLSLICIADGITVPALDYEWFGWKICAASFPETDLVSFFLSTSLFLHALAFVLELLSIASVFGEKTTRNYSECM